MCHDESVFPQGDIRADYPLLVSSHLACERMLSSDSLPATD